MTDEVEEHTLTPHPTSLTLGHLPFAVPDKIFGLTLSLDFIDRGTHCAFAVSATGGAQARGPSRGRLFESGINIRQHRHKNPATSIIAAFADMDG